MTRRYPGSEVELGLLDELLRRDEEPGVDQQLLQLVAADGVEADEDGAVAVVVRRREERLRTRLEQKRLLVEVAAHHEHAALVAEPGHEPALHLQSGRAVRGRLLDLGQLARDLEHVLPADHQTGIVRGCRAFLLAVPFSRGYARVDPSRSRRSSFPCWPRRCLRRS